MPVIRTLLGDIAPQELGFTYSHEHIVCIPPYWEQRNVDDLLLDDEEKSLKDVHDFKTIGGKSIVDATCIDYGRNVEAVARIAQKENIHIVGTAGFNKSFLWDAKIPERLKGNIIESKYNTFNEWIENSTIDQLIKHVANEIEVGMEGTSYRAGQVKFGTGYNTIKPLEEKTLEVAVRVHEMTNVPIHAHTESGTMGFEQIELLKKYGLKDFTQVSFGHMDRNPDFYYHLKIADTGAYLSFDGIAKVKYYPESTRIGCILNLVKHGHEDQILISGDTARKSYYKHYGYGLGLEYIKKSWVPRFIEEANIAGFDGEKLIDKFFVKNPQKCFQFD